MSRDIVDRDNHSVIARVKGQKGPEGNRLILGPFRFANHDCQPNSQIFPIKGSHAMTIVSIRSISRGEPITVAHTKSGYYRADCRCATCNPQNPPARLTSITSSVLPEDDPLNPRKRKARRGGRRMQRAKRAKCRAEAED
ncbi:hypothetical protein BJ138DRAFT_978742, partial [Hygrophoropsis aurantiaca]